MSLESGKKLGTTASLIAVVLPIIGAAAYVFLILSSIFASVSPGANSAASLDLIIVLFAVVGIVAFAGFILFVVAMHRLSDYYNEPGIYRNTLYGFIINIVGVIIALIFYVALIITTATHSVAQSNTQTTVATPIPTVPPILNSLGLIISIILVLLVVTVVIGILSAIFYMRAFSKLGEKSGVENFKTTGLLYLLGVALAIVGVGALLMWIAWILALIGFRSLKPKISETSTSSFAYSSHHLHRQCLTRKRGIAPIVEQKISMDPFTAGPAGSHNNKSRNNQRTCAFVFYGRFFTEFCCP